MRYLSTIALSLTLCGLFYAQSRKIDDAMLRNAAKSPSDGDWLSYGLTPGETRFSPLKLIDASNVKRLGLVWFYEAGEGGGDQEATPLVWNNTIFSVTNWSVVFALDVRTGKEKWRWDPEINRQATSTRMCCGVVNRGLALYNNKVYVPVNDGRLIALDADTGKPVWEARVSYPQNEQTLTMAPRIAKGKVIVGPAGGDRPTRGFVAAYDAETGREAWKFFTVPGDPSKGFESPAMRKAAATWDGEWWKLGGGGAVWDGVSYDPETELVYVGTGNAEPWPQVLRSKDANHDNLYVASILALDVDTGDLKWHYQVVPGDQWDYDSVQQMTLADLRINGRTRKVLMQANKNGFFYVLDRVTGEFISAQPFSRVTWAKGIDPKTGRPIVNPEVMYGKNPVPVTPGGGGAHNWSPMSYNPQTGLVYIPTRGFDTFNYAANLDFKPDAARTGGAGQTGLNNNSAGLPRQPAGPATGPEPLGTGNSPTLVAYDPVKQEVRWRVAVGNSRYGGTLSTASDLVFQVAPTGKLIAYSADKGEQLFEYETPGLGPGLGPPITFMVDGKQYIAFMGGSGGTQSPGQTGGVQSTRQKPLLMVFGLDGKAQLPKPGAPPTTTPGADPH